MSDPCSPRTALLVLVAAALALLWTPPAAAQEEDEDRPAAPPGERLEHTPRQEGRRRPEADEDRSPGRRKPPGREDGGPGFRPRPPLERDIPPLTEEQREERLKLLELLNPELADRIRHAPPPRVEQMLRERWPRIEQFMRMRQEDPEAFELRVKDMKLDRECRELGEQVRRAASGEGGQEARRLREQLREKVVEHFRLRQDMRERELAALERRIAELRQSLQSRIEHKDELIDRRVAELSAEAAEVGW